MKKITPQTIDITRKNIEQNYQVALNAKKYRLEQIAQLFPQVITEKEDENDNTIKAIDFELLKQHLSTDIVEFSDERYRLDYPGKRASILKENTPIMSKDAINPDHYKKYQIEVIDMMVSIFGVQAAIIYCTMTAFKYRMRLGHKDEISQELKKEKWYLDKAEELRKNLK